MECYAMSYIILGPSESKSASMKYTNAALSIWERDKYAVCLSSFKALLEVSFIRKLGDGLSEVVLSLDLLSKLVHSSFYWHLGGK